MEPENLKFGGGVAHTFLSPIVLVAIMLAGGIIFLSGRKNALAAFLCASILIPVDQVLYVGALHFPVLRIMAIFGLLKVGFAKLKAKEKVVSGGMNEIDWSLVVLSCFTLINGVLLWRELPEFIFQVGNLITAFGVYFYLRFVIRDEQDIRQCLRSLAYIAAATALVMIWEKATGVNLIYSTLGGARANVLGMTISRDDQLRAAGSFAHPILAGTFGGILLPLFVGLWVKEKKDRRLAGLGIAACSIIPFAASSSTALFGFLGGILGLCFWPLRRHMRTIRWAILIVLITLHLLMKAPVWHLISRIDLTGSSSSYHRYQLINQCILHFWDWVAIGTKDYAKWGWDMWDLSNQYAGTADTAGLIPLIAFLCIIVFAFKYVGKARLAIKGNRTQHGILDDRATATPDAPNAIESEAANSRSRAKATWSPASYRKPGSIRSKSSLRK